MNKWFGRPHSSRGLHSGVLPGTEHGLVGEIGASKTTLMNILYGFQRADRGRVLMSGRVIAPTCRADAIAAGTGMILHTSCWWRRGRRSTT